MPPNDSENRDGLPVFVDQAFHHRLAEETEVATYRHMRDVEKFSGSFLPDIEDVLLRGRTHTDYPIEQQILPRFFAAQSLNCLQCLLGLIPDEGITGPARGRCVYPCHVFDKPNFVTGFEALLRQLWLKLLHQAEGLLLGEAQMIRHIPYRAEVVRILVIGTGRGLGPAGSVFTARWGVLQPPVHEIEIVLPLLQQDFLSPTGFTCFFRWTPEVFGRRATVFRMYRTTASFSTTCPQIPRVWVYNARSDRSHPGAITKPTPPLRMSTLGSCLVLNDSAPGT